MWREFDGAVEVYMRRQHLLATNRPVARIGGGLDSGTDANRRDVRIKRLQGEPVFREAAAILLKMPRRLASTPDVHLAEGLRLLQNRWRHLEETAKPIEQRILKKSFSATERRPKLEPWSMGMLPEM